MWSKRISAMIIACALMLAGLSLCELSTAVAQEPLSPPLAAGTYGDLTPGLQYVPAGPAPKAGPAPEALTLSKTLAAVTPSGESAPSSLASRSQQPR